jgi:hypothetical protein
MHRGIGPGAASPAAVAFCRVQGMSVVAGACPYMFLPGSGLVHRLHGFLRGRRGLSQGCVTVNVNEAGGPDATFLSQIT